MVDELESRVIDSWRGTFEWHAEKWSEDAVDFARKKLEDMGISIVTCGVVTREDPIFRRCENGEYEQIGSVEVPVGPRWMSIKDGLPSWVLREILGKAEIEETIPGNLLLNEGIQRLQDMTMIATVTTNQTATNPWSNANAFMGVGDTATAEAATQTELLATANAANRFYKAMNATYPSRSSQTVSFQSDFTTGEANFAWNEWTVAAATTTASGSGFLTGTTNLNRKVASLGTKASGTWTLTGQVTLS